MGMKFLSMQGELLLRIHSSKLFHAQWFVKLLLAYTTFTAFIPLV